MDQLDYVSVHIRINKGGWTERLKNYLQEMNPGQTYPLQLFRRDGKVGQVVRTRDEIYLC